MRFKFTCSCGKRLAAYSWMVGKATECPKCNQMLTVPTPERAAEMMGPRGDDAPTRYHVKPSDRGRRNLAGWLLGALLAALTIAVIAIYAFLYFHTHV